MQARRIRIAPHLSRGFTLVELMIAVAILGIISAVAYPQYKDYVLRGSVADASTGLAAVSADMERFYQDNRTYATANGNTTPCGVAGGVNFGNFNISCGATAATTYTLLAAGKSGTNAYGFTYTLNESSVRATTATPSGSGWNTCASKWIMKKGDVCS